EMLLGSGEVPAKEANYKLSPVREPEAGVAALALGQVERFIGKRGGAGVVARDPNDSKVRNFLYNELVKVAAFLGQGADARVYLDSLGCTVPSCVMQHRGECARKRQLTRVTLG